MTGCNRIKIIIPSALYDEFEDSYSGYLRDRYKNTWRSMIPRETTENRDNFLLKGLGIMTKEYVSNLS